MNTYTYGWKRATIDQRDLKMTHLRLHVPRVNDIAIPPPSASLLGGDSPIFDQGQLGSCTANAWCGLLQYNERNYNYDSVITYQEFSRLFVYYNERVSDGDVDQDGGSELRTGAKVIANQGVCPESDWVYDITQFMIQPPSQSYFNALPNKITKYYNLDGENPTQTLVNIRTAIAGGQPIVFGFNVYESFETDVVAHTGIMPIPDTSTEQLMGGHAVMALGYNDAQQSVLVRNSWGTGWGHNGYFWMPYIFISDSNMASDFWTVTKQY